MAADCQTGVESAERKPARLSLPLELVAIAFAEPEKDYVESLAAEQERYLPQTLPFEWVEMD